MEMVIKWIELIIAVLSGLVVAIPLVVQLVTAPPGGRSGKSVRSKSSQCDGDKSRHTEDCAPGLP